MNKDPVHMVNISGKEWIPRKATAKGTLIIKKSTLDLIKNEKIRKGDPLTISEITAIQAVKKTPELFPLCHNIPLNSVDVSFHLGESTIDVSCTVIANYSTGVEMEALLGVSVALLNLWDMVKYLEKDENGQYPSIKIKNIHVTEKRKG